MPRTTRVPPRAEERDWVASILACPAMRGRSVTGMWLFGSRARGEARVDSDLDVALLCDPPLGADRPTLMDQAATALGCEVDVIDLATASAVLVWEVITTGKVVHEADALALERFVRYARYAAEDEDQRNRMVLLAQVGSVGGRVR